MSRGTLPPTRALVLSAVLLATGLAGCASDSGGSAGGGDALYDSYDAARRAPGRDYEPVEHNNPTDLHLKLLDPRDAGNVKQGVTPVVVLLYDPNTDQPVEDAEMTLAARMPAMGHGTSDEKDPAHDTYGVYEGQTNFAMPGQWVLQIDVRLPSAEQYRYEIDIQING